MSVEEKQEIIGVAPEPDERPGLYGAPPYIQPVLYS